MKCLGLLGSQHTGVAAVYWQTMDNQVRLALGAHHTARVLINGFNAAELDDCLLRENWSAATSTKRPAGVVFILTPSLLIA